MKRLHPPRLLPTLLVGVCAAWLAMTALPTAPVAEPRPGSAAPVPPAATGSLYPAPQVDASAPIAEPAPNF
jgi:hypothetical protein